MSWNETGLAMSKDSGQFAFMTCRTGAEAALKAEVARGEPAWRPAFSRPGFLTFKLPTERPIEDRQLAERQWVFAHAHGISLARIVGTELSQLVDQLWHEDGLVTLVTREALADIHVWQRDAETNEDHDPGLFTTPLAREIEHAIRAAAPEPCARLKRVKSASQPRQRRRPSERNALVLDVVVIEPGQWCVGYHRATTLPQRWPGGVIPVRMPRHAVSRAYLKMDEALEWSGLPLAAGDECVEIGCAPGGASQALLDRGLFVTGIDPAEVDPAVVEQPRFRHLRKRGHEVRRKEFLGVRWLMADMNVAPAYVLDTVEAIVAQPEVAVRGMILTLKFADWSDAERLPEFADRVRRWGYRDVRMRQLVTGGTEVCLAALRRKALRRLGRSRSRKRRRVDAPHANPPQPHR